MKKKRLIILLSFLIPIFILTGLALWIVTTDHVITPAYDENHTLAQYFAEETSVVYNGESQIPDVKDGVYSSDEEKENFLNTIEFYYKEYGKVGKYEKGAPTDAGNYSVKILSVLDSDNSTDTNNTVNDEKVEQEGALYVKFNINKANIVPTSTLTVNYDQEGNNGYFTTDKSLSSVTLNGTYVHSSISSLQVGEGKYSYTQDKLTVGNNTTYNFTFTPNNKNYNAYSSTIGITTYATVTYKDYNSTIINTLEIPYGSKLTEPTHSTRNGYTWNGWYNGSTAWNFANNTVTTDMTLIESWTVINYTITYNLNGGTVNGTNPSTYNIESGTITLINPTKNGYTFKGWSGTGIDGMSTSVSFSGSDLENKTFTANWWVPITITLSDKTVQYNESNQTLDSPKITLNGLSGSLPDGASIQYSYSPTTPKDVGDYTVTATLQLTQEQINNGYTLVDSSSDLSATLKITQAVIDVSSLSWKYDQTYPYTYSGSTYSVSLNGTVPSGVTVTTSGLSGVNAGDYTATVSFTLDDTKNYALSGSVDNLSWKINKKPVVVSGLSWKYDQSYPYTYSGSTYSVSIDGNIPDGVTITTSGLSAVNAGDYTAKATITLDDSANHEVSGGLADLSWKINKRKINVVYKLFERNYGGQITYTDLENTMGNGVSFKTSSGEDITLSYKNDYFVKGMNNGDFFYGYEENDSAFEEIIAPSSMSNYNDQYVVGTTYYAYFVLSDEFGINNELGDDYVGMKYKTVTITKDNATTYYTIEDALTAGGNIVLCGNSSNTVFTSFTSLGFYQNKLINGKYVYTLKGSSKLWLTYNGEQTLTSTTAGANSVYSVLYIPSNIHLIANGIINVCGIMTVNYHEISTRSVLFNNGLIELNNTLTAYGYVKGSGLIDAKSGSVIYDVMRMYNYYGSGGITLSVSFAKVFPITAYSFHNVSCKTKYAYDAEFKVNYHLDMTVTLAAELTLLGTGGLFELSNGYLIKDVEDTTGSTFSDRSSLITNYIKSNQDITQREVIELYGTFKDNIVSIEEMGYGITTGTDYPMAIGFMNIALKKDADGNVGNGTISANSYKFMPGSKLTVDVGAKLTIGASSTLHFYDESYDDLFTCSAIDPSPLSYKAKHSDWYNSTRKDKGAALTVNGTLNINGTIGALIDTSTQGAIVTVSNYTSSIKRVTSVSYGTLDKVTITTSKRTTATTTTDSRTSEMFIYDGTNVSTTSSLLTSGGVYSSFLGNNGKYGFMYASNAFSYTFKFDVDGGNNIDDITIYTLDTSGQYTIQKSDLPTAFKKYHSFNKWIVSATGEDAIDTIITANTSTKKGEISLKAIYTEKTYKINYVATFEDGTTGTYSTSGNTTSFIFGDTITINAATFSGYNFYGWYLSEDLAEDQNIGTGSFSFTDFMNKIPSTDFEELTLYGIFSKVTYYSLSYETNCDEKIEGSSYVEGSTINLPSLEPRDGYDFGGWFTNSAFTGTSIEKVTLNSNVIVYAKWTLTEYTLTYTSSNYLSVTVTRDGKSITVQNGGIVYYTDIINVTVTGQNNIIGGTKRTATIKANGDEKSISAGGSWSFGTSNVTANTTIKLILTDVDITLS